MKYYGLIAVAFIICLIISNLAATKVCNIFGLTVPGGIVIFPLLYVLNDVLTEVYGFSASRRVVWSALLCNLILSLSLYAVVFFPSSPYWHGQEAFAAVFSLSPRIFIASMISYLMGEMVNAWLISTMKFQFKGRNFPVRAIASTTVGSFLESMAFCYMAFLGRLPDMQILKMAVILTIIKVLYELAVIPFSSRLVKFLKKAENVDVFEKPSLRGMISLSSI